MRVGVLVAAMIAVVLPACSAGQDVDDTAALADARQSAEADAARVAIEAGRHAVPAWMAAGLAAADSVLAADRAQVAAAAKEQANTLPDKDTFIEILSAAGFKEKAAECVYKVLEESPDREKLAPAITTLADSVEGSLAAGGATTAALASGVSASSLTRLAGLDPEILTTFQEQVVPCLDSATLLALYSTLGGAGGGAGAGALAGALGGGGGALGGLTGAAGLAGILALLAGGGGGLGGLSLDALTGADGKALPGGSTALIAAVLALLSSGQAAELVGANPSALDPSKIDLNNISPDQLPLVIAAFLLGLTPAQRNQLEDVSGVNFGQLGIPIDPDKLTDQSLGALLLVSLPFIANGISPTRAGLPSGGDPTKVYVPPGADLSNINPLLFFPKDNFVEGLAGSGVQALFAGCIYESWKAVDPLLIGAGFSGGTGLGVGQLLLGILGCVGL